jgi:hypothetical protein
MMFTKRQALILRLLHKTKPRERSALLAGVEDDIIKVLTEMVHNTLRGNVPLTRAQWQRLHKYKQMLRTLSNRSVSLREKRSLLVKPQRGGGFLPILLPLVASAVGGVVNQLFNST